MKSSMLALASGSALLLVTAGASALPVIDKPAALTDLKDMGNGFSVMFMGDGLQAGGMNDDSMTVYFPWKRLTIAKNEAGEPVFGVAYSQKGALLSATLHADIDFEAVQQQFEKIKEGLPPRDRDSLRIAPVPVRRGVYRATLQTTSGDSWVMGATEVEQAVPTNETAVSILLNKKAADLVVMALQGNASVGYNYTYDFPARITPYEAEITVNWKSVMTAARKQFSATIGGGYGPLSAAGTYSVDKFTRKMIEEKNIEIRIIGGSDHTDINAVVMDVVKIVIARAFKANHPNPTFPDLKMPPANDRYVNNAILGMDFGSGMPQSGWNASVSASYQLNEMSSEEQVIERIHITSYPYQIFTATAGMQFGGMCTSHPHLFRYQGLRAADGTSAIHTGCPDRLLPDEGQEITPQTVPQPIPNPPVPNPSVPAPNMNDEACKIFGNC